MVSTLQSVYACYRDGQIGPMKQDPHYLIQARTAARQSAGLSEQDLDDDALMAALQTHEDLAIYYGFTLGLQFALSVILDLYPAPTEPGFTEE